MPKISATIFTKWLAGQKHPAAINDIFAWAIANGENLPQEPTCFGRYENLTGMDNIHQRILDDLAVFCARLEITVATAQHFAADPRIWTLTYKRFNDEGEQTFSNWSTVLTTEERQQAINYITTNSAITVEQIAEVFDATDTRREIAHKLKIFFRDV